MRRLLNILLLTVLLVSCTLPGAKTKASFEVLTHPDGLLYAGDRVSFEVLAPPGFSIQNASVQVHFKGKTLGSTGFISYGLGGRNEAILWWVWNTADLKPGAYTLTFTSQPDSVTWTETVRLHPAADVPPPEPEAHWATTTTVCCTISYITGTAAERDLATLGQEADQESAAVAAQMGTSLSQPINLIFMPRIIGHGGFTWDGVYVSYTDNSYIVSEMPILFHHEFVHYYDAAVGGDYRPSMFEEGLAVYLSGGHFKPEPIEPRAAAMFDLGWYIPLEALTNDFYRQQHETGYLEAAALIQYLVETYGLGAFNEFYRTIPKPENGQKDSDVIGLALQEHFGVSFADLETAYRLHLASLPVSADVRTDLRLTVSYFDTVRRYQKTLDPSAYFLNPWLPDGSVMRQQGIVADFLRHPEGWRNRLIEPLLTRAGQERLRGDYSATERTLKRINTALDWLAP